MVSAPAGSRVTERSEGKPRSGLTRVEGVLSAARNGDDGLELTEGEARRLLRFMVSQAAREKYPYVNESAWAERINGYAYREK